MAHLGYPEVALEAEINVVTSLLRKERIIAHCYHRPFYQLYFSSVLARKEDNE